MLDTAAPNRPDPAPALGPGADPDLALRLPADAYWHLVHTLRLALPPPPGDNPEDLLRRDHAAIAHIAGLCPANAAEADVAAQFVAASEQWKDCLRLAQLPETTPEWAAKCRAQAMAMMRQSNAALRLLLRMQQARHKHEANRETANAMAWSEHCAIRLMAEALEAPPAPRAMPAAAGPPTAAPPEPAVAAAAESAEARRESAAAAGIFATPRCGPERADQAPAASLAAAEQCAVLHPARAGRTPALAAANPSAQNPPVSRDAPAARARAA